MAQVVRPKSRTDRLTRYLLYCVNVTILMLESGALRLPGVKIGVRKADLPI